MSADPPTTLKLAIVGDDLAGAARCLSTGAISPRSLIDETTFNWNMPALAATRSSDMAELLIANGATSKQVSDWWAPGFGAHEVLPETAAHLIELGAMISPHAAAAIGLDSKLAELLADDPELVNAPGGDGCHPLHFARDVEIARLLIGRGADVDARDTDHNSTPAQWRVKDSPEVTRFLIEQGGSPDIFLAAALGDLDLTRSLIASDPDCTTQRIGYNNGAFPGIGHEGRGGTIYQWTLGFNLSPHEVALKNGHRVVYDLLFENTPPRHQLLVACTMANRELAESIHAADPTLVGQLDEEDKTLLAKFCWETNINIDAVRLMLDLGFPIDVPEPNHGFNALHNAAWCGNVDLVKLLLDRGHPTDRIDPKFDASALGYAIHSCTQAKRHPEGQFPEVVELLLAAGVPFDQQHYPVGDTGIDAVLQKHLKLS